MLVPLLVPPPLENFTKSAALNTDTGLDYHITAAEDPDAVEARGIKNPSVLGLKPPATPRSMDCRWALLNVPFEDWVESSRIRKRMSLSAEVAPSARFKKLMPSLTLRAASSMDACGRIERRGDGQSGGIIRCAIDPFA